MAMMSAKRIILILCLIAAAIGLHLGLKTARLTETDIIDHYVSVYLDQQLRAEQVADSSECFAKQGRHFWERMRVICQDREGAQHLFSIGPWGQALSYTKEGGTL